MYINTYWVYKSSDFAYVYDEVGTGREKEKERFYPKVEFSEYLCLNYLFLKLLKDLSFTVWNRSHPFKVLFYCSFLFVQSCPLSLYSTVLWLLSQMTELLDFESWHGGRRKKKEMFILLILTWLLQKSDTKYLPASGGGKKEAIQAFCI